MCVRKECVHVICSQWSYTIDTSPPSVLPSLFSLLSAEFELVARINNLASKNDVYRSYIGLGYHNCIMPNVIKRNILENPGW